MSSATLTFDLVRICMALPFGIQPLNAVGSAPFHWQGPLEFVGTKILSSQRATVLRGVIRSSQDPSVEREVVCKYRGGDISTIEHEARIYQEQLEELQGVAVPRFHGLFTGAHYERDGKKIDVACIFLEYFEQDRKWDLWKGPIKTRGEIAVAMLKIHFSGIMHCAFRDEHVLVSADGEVRIVDFAHACEHDCDADPVINVWAWETSRRNYGCDEMYNVYQQLGLWTPRFVPFMATYADIFAYPDAEALGQWFFDRFCCSNDPAAAEDVKESAKWALERYYARYEERFPKIGDPRKLKNEREQRALRDGSETPASPSGSS
ncbi:hypothetical protein PsYK624_080300 [Phanerochaete sordida]|uniref:Protein kinase domain-containing protein n=1 Tax=Phanerochaete sordida TaxID=48140 RepID=A0A9P3GDN5_9APHY|nr:hypothetical protein PsYK624_080300 [Phanerochaete sordida]